MTLLILVQYAIVHLAAWATLFRWLTPRWRVALALVLPPLVALHLWERSESAPDARERKRALVTALVWVGSLSVYVLWSSVT